MRWFRGILRRSVPGYWSILEKIGGLGSRQALHFPVIGGDIYEVTNI